MNFDAFARFYEGDYRNYTADIPLVLKMARAAGRAVPAPQGEQKPTVLELGCGSGRVLRPLAAAGCEVTGVDRSAGLLAIARQKTAAFSSQTTLVQADMRTVRLAKMDFDFVFIVSNTLMHLTTQVDQLAALESAYHHLRVGGLLLIDLFNPDIAYLESVSGMQELADQWEDEQSGAWVLKWTSRYLDVAQQRQETIFIYEEIFPDGCSMQTKISFPLRFWWPSEGVFLLEKAGFVVEEMFGDFDSRPYDDNSERLIFIARKANTSGA